MKQTLLSLLPVVLATLVAVVMLGHEAEARMTPDVYRARAWLQRRMDDRHFACLHRLVAAESGWRVHARTGSAYGLSQSLPGRKMRTAERPARGPLWDSWRHDALVQASWTLRRIRVVYNGACAALRFQNARGYW